MVALSVTASIVAIGVSLSFSIHEVSLAIQRYWGGYLKNESNL